MDFKTLLEKTQPIVFNTFYNARRNNKVAQQYLIKGENGTPTLETALFLAKSLICENEEEFILPLIENLKNGKCPADR